MKNDKPGLLITLVDLHFGGISSLILQTSPSLEAYFNVHVVYFGPNKDMLDRYINAGIKIERIVYNGGVNLVSAAIKLKEYIIANEIEIVSTNFVPDKLIVSLARLFTKFYIIGTIHNSFNPEITPIKSKTWRYRFEEFFHNRIADKIIGVSEAAINMAVKYRNLNNRNTAVVHSGINGISAQVKQKNKPIVFMTACRFVEVKGLARLIERFQVLNNTNIDWQLWLIGDGKLFESLKKQVAQYGLDNKIQFKGYQNNLIPFYREANFYINSSLNEALGVSIIEAMSAGLPIIGSKVGGIPEVVEHEGNGYLIDFDNEEQSVNCLRQALELSDISYTKFSVRSREIFDSKFSIHKYVNQLNIELKQLIN